MNYQQHQTWARWRDYTVRNPSIPLVRSNEPKASWREVFWIFLLAGFAALACWAIGV